VCTAQQGTCYWNGGEPNNGDGVGENCIQMLDKSLSGNNIAAWNDIPCGNSYNILCEYAKPCSSNSDCPTSTEPCLTYTCNSGVCSPQALSGTVCRASAGVCDQAETCDGTNYGCPADQFVSGTVCRADNGDCDVAETCDGSSAACPPDSFEAHGTICTLPHSYCDTTCSGSSPTCQCTPCSTDADCTDDIGPCGILKCVDKVCAKRYLSSSHVCRAAEGDCEDASTCTGVTAECPDNLFKPDCTVCRAAVGDCEGPARCSGTSADCPENPLLKGNVCRAPTGDCDAPEYCDGSGLACPADCGVYPQGTICGAPPDDCGCDGVNDYCPACQGPSSHHGKH